MSFKGFLVTEENVTESSQVKLAAQLEQFCNSCNVFAKRGQKILQMGKRGKKRDKHLFKSDKILHLVRVTCWELHHQPPLSPSLRTLSLMVEISELEGNYQFSVMAKCLHAICINMKTAMAWENVGMLLQLQCSDMLHCFNAPMLQ